MPIDRKNYHLKLTFVLLNAQRSFIKNRPVHVYVGIAKIIPKWTVAANKFVMFTCKCVLYDAVLFNDIGLVEMWK